MSKTTRFLSAIAVAAACAVLGYASSASAAVPQSLTQQGRLLDSAGTPIDADISFVFSIYSVATGGTALWTETQTVTVDQGYFSARLGETTAFPATLFDGTKTLYLGIKIGTDGELAPRQLVNSVPFALHAANADHATAADTATNATHATSADTATTATSATSATNATNATTAAAVTSIASNFTTTSSGAQSNTATAQCATGYIAASGGCNATAALEVNSFVKGDSTKFQCTCVGTCTVTAYAACVK